MMPQQPVQHGPLKMAAHGPCADLDQHGARFRQHVFSMARTIPEIQRVQNPIGIFRHFRVAGLQPAENPGIIIGIAALLPAHLVIDPDIRDSVYAVPAYGVNDVFRSFDPLLHDQAAVLAAEIIRAGKFRFRGPDGFLLGIAEMQARGSRTGNRLQHHMRDV